MLQVTGPPDALTVTARGETRTLTDPETELSELIGWWLPVASLPHWLLGFPDRGFRAVDRARRRRHARRRSSNGSGASHYPAYGLAADRRRRASEVLVPRRIDLTHGELTLKLTIDDWQPAATQLRLE